MSQVKKYLTKTINVVQNISIPDLERGVELVREAWMGGKKIIVIGNGGSALTALHYINDWNKSIFLATGRRFDGRTLTDNVGLITSYANDISYQDIFVEQLKNILCDGDLLIAISGSGNSENIIRAVDYANKNNAVTLGLSGFDGGRLKAMVQHSIWANISDMQVSEDVHFMFGHIVMQTLCGYSEK